MSAAAHAVGEVGFSDGVGDGARVFGELQKLGIITRPMAGYQLPEWLRVSVGTAAENERFLAGLKHVLGKVG